MAIGTKRRDPEQDQLVTVRRLGKTFKASKRTVAWLDYVIADFRKQFPKAQLVMLQSCYNTGVAASAGTHDYDAVFDFSFTGTIGRFTFRKSRQWWRFQKFFRQHYAAAWYRHTGSWSDESAWHVHCFPLPVGLKEFSTRVGIYVDGGASQGHPGSTSSQLVDYVELKAFGLTGEHNPGSDKSWRPATLSAFPYWKYKK